MHIQQKLIACVVVTLIYKMEERYNFHVIKKSDAFPELHEVLQVFRKGTIQEYPRITQTWSV